MHALLCPMCGAPAPAPAPPFQCSYCRFHVAASAAAPPAPAGAPVAAPAPAAVPLPAATASSFLTDAAALAVAQRHLGALPDVHYAPAIPRDKEANARRVHAAHLPPDEPVVCLLDTTVFGSAEEGMVVTRNRVCFKNIAENPQSVPWRGLDTAKVGKKDDGEVWVMGMVLHVGTAEDELTPRTVGLLGELASEAQRLAGVSAAQLWASQAAAGGGLTDQTLIALCREIVGLNDSLFYAPGIPRRKLDNVREVFAGLLPAEEPIAVLYDDTVFGSAKNGVVLTPRRVCWKGTLEPARAFEWGHLDPAQIGMRGEELFVAGAQLPFVCETELAGPFGRLLGELARRAR